MSKSSAVTPSFKENITPYLPNPWHLGALCTIIIGQFVIYKLLAFRPTEAFFAGNLLIGQVFEMSIPRAVALLIFAAAGVLLPLRYSFKSGQMPVLSRVLYLTVLLTQCYTIALMDYNHYYDTWFWADRILLVALAVLAAFHPLTLPLLLLQLILLTNQLAVPDIIGYDVTHKSLIIPFFAVFWLLALLHRLFPKRVNPHTFVFVTYALVGTWYMQAGIEKMRMEWLFNNNLYNLFAASVQSGWLEDLPRNFLIQTGEILDRYRVFFQGLTLFIEIVVPLLLFTRRKITIYALFLLMILHFVIYLSSGVFFWQWILLEVVTIIVLFKYREETKKLFAKSASVFYLAALILLTLFTDISKLAWYDCAFLNTFSFVLIDEGGNEQLVNASYFSPYDTGFAKNRFYFTRNDRNLSGTLGNCYDSRLVNLKQEINSAEVVTNIRLEKNNSSFNQDKTDKFYQFLTTYARNKSAYDPKLISHIDAPNHMQQGRSFQNLTFPNVKSVKIIYREEIITDQLRTIPVGRDSVLLPISH